MLKQFKWLLNVVIPHSQHEPGKVIGVVTVHINIYVIIQYVLSNSLPTGLGSLCGLLQVNDKIAEA